MNVSWFAIGCITIGLSYDAMSFFLSVYFFAEQKHDLPFTILFIALHQVEGIFVCFLWQRSLTSIDDEEERRKKKSSCDFPRKYPIIKT